MGKKCFLLRFFLCLATTKMCAHKYPPRIISEDDEASRKMRERSKKKFANEQITTTTINLLYSMIVTAPAKWGECGSSGTTA